MVSFTRGDVADPGIRSAVLEGYTPQETTVYNTSLELLQVWKGTAIGRPASRKWEWIYAALLEFPVHWSVTHGSFLQYLTRVLCVGGVFLLIFATYNQNNTNRLDFLLPLSCGNTCSTVLSPKWNLPFPNCVSWPNAVAMVQTVFFGSNCRMPWFKLCFSAQTAGPSCEQPWRPSTERGCRIWAFRSDTRV
jgi:hypothetical protein